ncbi:hypothetical protein L1049_010188 [Liquidambar formosana]|uniref:Pentatricopeptide repeat-containing protein n=1 Tax=Liquidambar formosana TaxID=63359 RepID=A0AAP0NAZ4_LIQFO
MLSLSCGITRTHLNAVPFLGIPSLILNNKAVRNPIAPSKSPMKSVQQLLLFSTPSLLSSLSKPISLFFSSFSSSSSTATVTAATVSESINLTQEELTKINLLIPRLCYSNHLPEAIRLVHASLLTNPPLKFLPLPILVDCLVSQPDMTQLMSFLTRLKHNPPAHPSLLPINTMLISSYFKKSKPKEAMKVFTWMSRPGSPCAPDAAIYGILAGGFCRHGLNLGALKVLRAMVGANFWPGSDLRKRIFRNLLREARIREAKELDGALASIGVDGDKGVEKVMVLLERMIANWTD